MSILLLEGRVATHARSHQQQHIPFSNMKVSENKLIKVVFLFVDN